MANDSEKIVLIATNANPELSQAISTELSLYTSSPLSKTNIVYFSNSEIKVEIGESVRGRSVFIIGSGCSNDAEDRSVNDHLMEVLIACSACRTSDARSITVILPCFPYARQDKKNRSREPITARLVCSLLETAGATRIMSMDLHSDQIQGMASIPFDNLFAEQCLIQRIENDFGGKLDPEKWKIAAPDAGALKRARHLGQRLGIDIVLLEKQRDYSRPNTVLTSTLIGDVDGKDVFIVDDMCDTAGTLVAGAKTLVENGAKSVYVGITHGIFSGPALARIAKSKDISKVYTSNTVPQTNTRTACEKIRVYTVAKLFVQAIHSIQTNQSISKLFE